MGSIITLKKPLGIWKLVADHYKPSTNLKIKDYIRVVRQANPGWMTWPNQEIPKGTSIFLPDAGWPFLPVRGSSPVAVKSGEGLSQVLQRHCRERYRQELRPNVVVGLVPTLETINCVRNDELEPKWTLYMPDEVILSALGKEPLPGDTTADLADFEITLNPITPKSVPDSDWKKSPFYTTTRDVAANSFAQYKDAIPYGMLKDLFSRNVIKVNPYVSSGKSYVTLKGSNRELLKALGLNGTRYRVGSEKYVAAMKQFSKQTGMLISTESSVIASAVKGMGTGLSKAVAWGAGISIAIDAGAYIIDGKADQILTKKFMIDAADGVTNSVIASGAGAMASALTVAYMASGAGSVVPGVGTLVGFVVGLGVGLALNYFEVKWW